MKPEVGWRFNQSLGIAQLENLRRWSNFI